MKFIGYYDVDDSNRSKRNFFHAARNKMQYIANTLCEWDKIEIISPSGVTGDHGDRSRKIEVGDNIQLKLFRSLGRKNHIIGKLSSFFTKLEFTIYLLINTKKNEPVIVYHSLALCNIIKILKKIKKPQIILEVEEIYADVIENSELRKKELAFIKSADKYIFPTRLLSDAVNDDNKPEIIIHGTYQVEPERKKIFLDDDVIHCVYAGTFDPRKGGCAAAAAVAEFLPENYHVHILGFGSEAEIRNMKKLVNDISEKSKAKITYDGLLSGEEYIEFIQSCDIGLSTQNPNADFNATSFPSKILSYLANGLRVVSVRIPAIETSAVNDLLYYYNEQIPEEIAKAIMKVDMNDNYDGRSAISKLDKQFSIDIQKLLGGS